jgi:hypothetical protein
MQPIDIVVAQTSPNLYAAAKQANLDPAGVNQIEQMSYAVQQHKKLMAMEPEQAKQAYTKLDPQVQSGLKFLYKDAQYAATPPSIQQDIIGGLKTVGKAIASPIIGLFKVAGAYNRVINLPYLIGREVAQGDGSVFDAKIWKKAWDGNAVFDNGALQKATDVFGINDVTVAKGLIAGKTPGEIIQAYGKVDQGILDSITKAYNKPQEFKQVLDATKYAQVSPGRDLARMLDDKPVPSGGVHGDYINGATKNISGVVDTFYQILVDPLTWLTGGGSKAATIGERLATTLNEVSKEHGTVAAVQEVMKHPQVYNLWQNELGPSIKRFAQASTDAEKSAVYRAIARNFPGYADRGLIEKLASDEHKVFNADGAQKFFENANNTTLMMSGRVDGVTYARNAIVTAKANRNYADGVLTYLDSIFNPTTSKSLGRLKTEGRSIEEVEKGTQAIYNAAIKTGETLDGFAGPNPELLKVINEQVGDIKKLKAFGYWFGKQAARSPAGMEIRIGERAAETAQNFSMVARQLLPRDMAETMTTKFLNSGADEQVVILRNIYAGIMMKFGMHGEPKGTELMQKILREKFGTKAGFATMVDTAVPDHFVNSLEQHSIRSENNNLILQSEDAIQPYHSTQAIGALPYDQIATHVAEMKSKKNLLTAVLGIGSGPFAKKAVDAWSMLTLLPRLGIRSAIDEGMMYVMTAPGRDLLNYALRRGHKAGQVSTAFTGSKAAVGPIRELIGKVFPKVDPTNALSVEKRQEIILAKAKELGVDPNDLYDFQKREAIVEALKGVYSSHLDAAAEKYFHQGLVHSPDMLNSVAQSLVGHSSLSGNYDEKILAGIITPSALDKALEELSLKAGRKTRSIDTKALTDNEVALAHFDNWFRGFVANKAKLPNGRIVDPAHVFLSNNALKTEEDVKKAMDEMSAAIGVVYDPAIRQYVVKDQEAVDAFKALSARTVEMKSRGIDDAALVRDQVGRILVDLYTTFHGGANNFNEALLGEVKSLRSRMIATSNREFAPTWSQSAAGMDFKRFVELTHDNRPTGQINTAIEFPGFTDVESLFRREGNRWMEWMDRQITGIHRQAALNVTFTEVRKNWAGIERQWVNDHVNQMIKDNPERYGTPKSIEYLTEQVKSMGEKKFTELGMQHAANEVLKYADNPAVRSNFSYGVRTVGRYYRATEDFQRRMYRLKEVPLRVLYRMRLAHLGLSASGSVYTDSQGNPYVMVPMDNVLFKATDTTIRALTGKDIGYHQPLFNDLTMKLNMINPSFQQDSGLPMLSGPIAGLGVIGMKNLLGYTHNPLAIEAGQVASTAGLGNFGTNTNLAKALIPSTVQRVWDMLPVNEKSRQEVTAAQQAMAYNAANGVKPLDANATAEEKAAYLKDLRISAHNIIFLRNFLGFISPATPTMQESKGVPDYLLRVGVSGLRPEFFDILNGISKTNVTGDVQDPYEQALVTFMGKNPGKLIYTVSRDAKQTRVVVKNTQELNTWAIEHKSMVDTYGEAAYIFAPQTGQFNANSFNYLQAAGLIQNKTLEQYYNDLLVTQDKQSYYDVATQEKAALAAEPDPNKRSLIIGAAADARESLKQSNPLLNAALIGQGNNIGNETKLLTSLDQIVQNPNTGIDNNTRIRMATATKLVKDYLAFATDPNMKNAANFTELKLQRKQEIEANLDQLMIGNPYLQEANRAIFKSILSFYSRDTYVAFKAGF